jgi:anti-sigma factor RsiW
MIGDPATHEELLHAYIDGELAEDGRAAFEQGLARDPQLANRLALFEADKARIAQIYGPLADRPLPARWIEMIDAPMARRGSGEPLWYSIEAIAGIAAVLMLLIGGSLVYRENAPHEEPIIEEALAARSDVLPAYRSIPVSASRETLAAHTLSPALGMRVGVPDLRRMGYSLIGLRVYTNLPGGKAVELLYRQKDNRVFALYLRRPSGPARFDQYKKGGLRVCIWQDNVLGAVMTGEMSAAEMQRLASLAYTGLEA